MIREGSSIDKIIFIILIICALGGGLQSKIKYLYIYIYIYKFIIYI